MKFVLGAIAALAVCGTAQASEYDMAFRTKDLFYVVAVGGIKAEPDGKRTTATHATVA